MRRYFNTEGCCKPQEHYMVNLEKRLARMRQMVERRKYFVVNRGRQYGKTTTLMELKKYLQPEYIAIFMDFQMIGNEEFATEGAFSAAFVRVLERIIKAGKQEYAALPIEELEQLEMVANSGDCKLRELFFHLSELCAASQKPIVLIIDEVDSATNNQVFLDFLAQLRAYYLQRDMMPIFHSVILAGVYDIKNLKLKIRSEAESKYNSPWNIAVSFDMDMSLSVPEIVVMLREYEEDHQTGMAVEQIAKLIYEYTSGYPFLVSYICKLLDEVIPEQEPFTEDTAWTESGLIEAVKYIQAEPSTLFESMIKQLNQYPELHDMLYQILFVGDSVTYNLNNLLINLAAMFCFVKEQDRRVVVANRIFETVLYDYFLSENEMKYEIYKKGQLDKSQFIKNNRLDMNRVLQKFVTYYTDIYSDNDQKFLEDHGRKLFLLYLRPIINGTGNYYIEAETRNARRTDVIVDYMGEQFIIEMKIWHGQEYNERGEQQLVEYLDYYHKDIGYMLSFNFNQKKKPGVQEISIGDKLLIEAVV